MWLNSGLTDKPAALREFLKLLCLNNSVQLRDSCIWMAYGYFGSGRALFCCFPKFIYDALKEPRIKPSLSTYNFEFLIQTMLLKLYEIPLLSPIIAIT